MREYGQYCPVARAAEVLTDRWTLLILRELINGARHFNDLDRGLPGISRSLLAQRLCALVRAGVLERRVGLRRRATEYALTSAGQALREPIRALGAWGARWAFGEPRPEELDPVLLLWRVRGRINRDLLPPHRVVVEFNFPGSRRSCLWLVLERHEVSLCLKHPGFDPDLAVTADLAVFYQVWLGRLTLAEALRRGKVRMEGSRTLERAFPQWLQWSPMAPVVREAMAAARAV
jgi:DNA-binding HxlR family transcriptional regulator